MLYVTLKHAIQTLHLVVEKTYAIVIGMYCNKGFSITTSHTRVAPPSPIQRHSVLLLPNLVHTHLNKNQMLSSSVLAYGHIEKWCILDNQL